MGFQLIIFDLGGVLIRVEPQRMLRALAQETGQPVEQIERIMTDPSLMESFELGRISPTQFFAALNTRVRTSWTFDQFVSAWNSILSENTEATSLLQRLRLRYTILVLTNTNILHDDYIRRTSSIFDQAHHWIVSYQVGLRKPQPQIYRVALRQADVSPEAAIYVDDREENIVVARHLGVTTIHMTDGLALEDELRAAGLRF